ncbi:precorrin-6y C5,15-methyltransferase (decarboxylating) subunit CbiE [Roseococcus sp. SYP-B2431]|uniref:precorrin-6y C5,15-methyltransferase (decarboxylating) subunit CbiE n=1 Tax=Roseococcus sp. SYP-B2431 TaxID=2496640 RepID=UPI001981731F|nr:precorrin-6y C5,15-methyltransferase (decarboxylating) subunit CbiE [Roseococcus sp. SYP-B2431]
MPAETAAGTRWLSILGLGEEGVVGLPPLSRGLVAGAEIVFGGRRHLELAAPLIRGEARPWPSPFDVSGVLAERGRRVVVLASGDPMWHGVGATLLRRMPPAEALVVPAPSAFSLAAARLGWPMEGVVTLSLHGRPIELLRPHLHPGARILALTSDALGPAAIAELLRDGFADTRLTVLEALGGKHERIREGIGPNIAPLNLVALEVVASPGARILPRAPGLPDHFFEHDGQLTKREIRAVTLSALAPRRGALLWDIGAGAGSIGIEWMLADPSLRAIAIEARADRAARLRRNALALGVPGLSVVEDEAPAALAGLEPPDAVFLGGGAGDALDAALAALKPGGRCVANAVTLETEALLLARRATLGGEMLRLAVSRAEPVGGLTGWRAAMPVTQWIWDKPA